jgi:hypothetical protein
MSTTLPNPHDSESIATDAVEFCVLAWNDAFDQHRAKGKDEYSAARYAHKAFRQALPDLTSPAKIQGFIACVSRGVLIGAIEHADASRLLYAAQVARQAVNAEQKPTRESRAKKPVQAESAPENEQATA